MKKFLLLFICFSAWAARLLDGNKAVANQTFNFPIQQHVQTIAGDVVYVAAAPSAGGAGLANNFAIARISLPSNQSAPPTPDFDQFMRLTPEKVNLNGVNDLDNPLFDKGISFLRLMQLPDDKTLITGATHNAIAVPANDLTTLYLFFIIGPTNISLISATNGTSTVQNIPDTTGIVSGGIVSMDADRAHVLAAVLPNSGSFGDPGTGIAEVVLGAQSTEGGNSGIFAVVDAPTGEKRDTGNRAIAFDRTSSPLIINSELASMENPDLVYNRFIDRFYIGYTMQGNTGGSDGGRAIGLAGLTRTLDKETNKVIDTNAVVLLPIAPDAVFDGAQDKIIGAVGADAQVSIHKIRSMRTSTALDYLIVQGGNGSPSTTRRSVFALPLVNGNETIELNGTIANKLADPEDILVQGALFRRITQPATTPAQMTTSSDAAAQVGRGQLPFGDIVDMYVQTDAVFVSVTTPDSSLPGLFYSQALFDSTGKIKAWTAWKRTAGVTEPAQSVNINAGTGNFTYIASNGSEFTNVKRTIWSTESEHFKDLITFIGQELPTINGGIQGAFDFPVTTTGLNDISVLAFTGLEKVILAQSGTVSGGIETPTSSYPQLLSFTNGTINQTLPVDNANLLAISGGALSTIGPVVAAEIGTNSMNGWLFVGGSGGLAVLSQEDGSGWDPTTELASGFDGLTAGMTMKLIGDYTNVRKIINDERYLYVLTDKKLDRIDLNEQNPGLGQLAVTTLAQAQELEGFTPASSFLDLIVSEQVALLATSNGLLANRSDVRAANAISIGWRLITLPEGLKPVQQLYAISSTGRAQDVSRNNGGNVYVLNAYAGQNQARLYRLSVEQTETQGITDTTVQLLPDLFQPNTPSFFTSYGQFQNLAATDGAFFFSSRSSQLTQPPQLRLLSPALPIQSGFGSLGVRSLSVPLVMQDPTIVSQLLRPQTTGSWLVTTNANLQANE